MILFFSGMGKAYQEECMPEHVLKRERERENRGHALLCHDYSRTSPVNKIEKYHSN